MPLPQYWNATQNSFARSCWVFFFFFYLDRLVGAIALGHVLCHALSLPHESARGIARSCPQGCRTTNKRSSILTVWARLCSKERRFFVSLCRPPVFDDLREGDYPRAGPTLFPTRRDLLHIPTCLFSQSVQKVCLPSSQLFAPGFPFWPHTQKG